MRLSSEQRRSRCTRGQIKRSILGNAIAGGAGDIAAGRQMVDDNRIIVRDGGDGVACHGGHGNSEPNIEGLHMRARRMGKRILLFVEEKDRKTCAPCGIQAAWWVHWQLP
jgi:hypothetical protein